MTWWATNRSRTAFGRLSATPASAIRSVGSNADLNLALDPAGTLSLELPTRGALLFSVTIAAVDAAASDEPKITRLKFASRLLLRKVVTFQKVTMWLAI